VTGTKKGDTHEKVPMKKYLTKCLGGVQYKQNNKVFVELKINKNVG